MKNGLIASRLEEWDKDLLGQEKNSREMSV
jgi:hypothetical protein